MGGFVLVCTSKATTWASETLGSATNCRVVSLLSEPRCWDLFLLHPGQLQTFPCSQPDWDPVKNPPGVSPLRVLNALYQYLCRQDFPFSGIPCKRGSPVWLVYHRTPNCRTPRVKDTPNTHTPCPQTASGVRHPMSHPAEQRAATA